MTLPVILHSRAIGGNSGRTRLALQVDRRDSFFFSSRRRHTRFDCDWSSDVCSSDLAFAEAGFPDRGIPEFEKAISLSGKVRGGHYSLGGAYLLGLGNAMDEKAAAELDRKSVV